MKKKRLLCAVLALVLLFSAKPAKASNKENQRSIVITTSCRRPIVRVAVTNYASVYINPLNLPIYIDGEADREQIVSTPACAINCGDVPLAVDVSVTGTIKQGSDMTLSPSPTNGSGTAKSAFIYFEIQHGDIDDPDYVEWDSTFDSSKHIVISNGGTTTKNNIFTLNPLTLDGEIAEGGCAPFRLTGDAVREPTNPWNNKDGINVAVSFTFTPIPYDS